MRGNIIEFTDALRQLADAEINRDRAITDTYEAFRMEYASLAIAVEERVGDKQFAARWMSTRRRHFGGRSAYETVMEGDFDSVWDRIVGSDGKEQPRADTKCANFC